MSSQAHLSDAGMSRTSPGLSTSISNEADRARERIESYKDRRRQELSAKYGALGGVAADASGHLRLERGKTDPTNKTENSAGSIRRTSAERMVRETKASRLRAASHTNRTEEKPVPSSSRRDSADKSQLRKSFLNRSHTSEPTKEDSLNSGTTIPRRKSGSHSTSAYPSVNGLSTCATTNAATANTTAMRDPANLVASECKPSKPTLRITAAKTANGHDDAAMHNTSAIQTSLMSKSLNGHDAYSDPERRTSKSFISSSPSLMGLKGLNGHNSDPERQTKARTSFVKASMAHRLDLTKSIDSTNELNAVGKSTNCSPRQVPKTFSRNLNGHYISRELGSHMRKPTISNIGRKPSVDGHSYKKFVPSTGTSASETVAPEPPPPPPAPVPVKPSILKKKSVEEPPTAATSSKPVSILKRKTLSQDGAVTFSPSVVDKEQNRKKQGILKKRRSLDESEVGRRRSSSPDKSILKVRRSSMEDLTSILKRDSTETLHELQGILKRKSATPPLQQHVTIADTVIMAAAVALGEVQPTTDTVRPILKKKSSSEEHTPEMSVVEPRPILKKKSVEVDDVPFVKPILKTSRKSSEEELPTASILKKPEGEVRLRRARSVSSHERARSAPPSRPLSLAERGTDYHIFLQNELQWSPPQSPIADGTILAANEELAGQMKVAGVGENASAKDTMESTDQLELPVMKPKEVKNVGVNRFRERKLRDAARFRTQPVSSDVSGPATSKTDETGEGGEEDALSKLSLTERVHLFNSRIKELGAAAPAPDVNQSIRRPRSARFKTQPVTDEEMTQVRTRPPGAVMVLPPVPSASTLKSILKRGSTSAAETNDSDIKPNLTIHRESPNGAPSRKLKLPYTDDNVPLKLKLPINREAKSDFLRCDEGTNLAKILQDVTQEAERTSSCLVKSQSHSAVASVFHKEGKTIPTDDATEPLGEEEDMVHGLRRSTTQPLRSSEAGDEELSGLSIKERLAKLRQSGEMGWQKRKTKLKSADEMSVITTGNYLFNGAGDIDSPSILASRLGQLDTARQSWKSRIPQSDAVLFTVEGKMGITSSVANSSLNGDYKKRSPKQARFRSKNFVAELHSSPASPVTAPSLTRSLSAPGGDDPPDTPPIDGPTVPVPRADDETFEAFFQSLLPQPDAERLEINLEDFDAIQRTDSSLLVQKRNVQVQRRRRTTRNPVKSLAMRANLQNEYVEVKTGVAERELRRLKVEKMCRGGSLAVEALAGLASTEDFTAVNLKKPVAGPVQYPDMMLLRIKGRRHVETRLVEPVPASVNKGDCYLLVTRSMVALYLGELSNVVERARAKEVAARVEAGELDCSASRISQEVRFWAALGGGEPADAGPADEDEQVEVALMATNMVFELTDHELVPLAAAWGSVPKVEILQPHKNLVFDFGSEMYVWSGKSAPLAGRREATALARELWEEGFDYSDCDWSPLGIIQGQRPPWALFSKITQNMEPVIFREKFLDWPDEALVSRHVGVSEPDGSSMMEVRACDVEVLLRERPPWPDLELEGTHLGRGVNYLDEETRRVSEVSDLQVLVWRVSEFEHSEITDPRGMGQFREEGSYVVKWHYSVAVTVRGLNGAPSRHSAPGRDRYAYFLWHGRHSPPGDRGAAAVLTVSLDTESAPHVIVSQLAEPPAFLRLFAGSMAVHRSTESDISLYLVRGSALHETMLLEVEPVMKSLRSRACFLIIDRITSTFTLWCGCKTTDSIKEIARNVIQNILQKRPLEFRLRDQKFSLNEENEGSESKETISQLKKTDGDYYSLINSPPPSNLTPRLFHFTSTSGEFAVSEVASPLLHPDGSSPYLFLQSDLYSASQPALFLLDAGDVLWLWHGWTEAETAPSAVVRHQAERRAAMQTAIRYWERTREIVPICSSLVWAGLEPLEFIALFPFWELREDVTELNKQETNRQVGEKVDLETELNRLMCTRYPLDVLLQRPLPDGVDPTQLEDYLEPDAFPELFEMTKEEFMELPSWKKNSLKKEKRLF